MILPALTEAISPCFRPIKYSLFPPLGLATLAAYLTAGDEIAIHDEHVEHLNTHGAKSGNAWRRRTSFWQAWAKPAGQRPVPRF